MRVWWLVALCACSRSATDRPADCDKTITAASVRIVAESEAGRRRLAVDPERARLTMIASCEDERWTADVMHCIETARLEIDLATCTERLTHEQYERLQRKLAAVRDTAVIDAGVVVAVDAAPVVPVVDAAVVVDTAPVVTDAMVPADAAIRRPVPRAPIDAAPAGPDCHNRVVDSRDKECVRQFCRAHPDDLRCQVDD